MRVVVGRGPLARAVAAHLSVQTSVVLAGTTPIEGPWLWRRADPATGAGIRGVVEGARAVHAVIEPGERVDGLLMLLSRASRVRASIVTHLGAPAPGLPVGAQGVAWLQVGPVWGPEEPLIRAWASQLVRGGRVWVADPGPIRPVSMDAAVAAAVEVADHPGARWTLAGHQSVRLADLAEQLAHDLALPSRTRRVPVGWAAWRAGVTPERLRSWTRVPEATSITEGWVAPSRGRAAWLGPVDRWRPTPAG